MTFDYDNILARALKRAQQEKPDASPQHQAAFANAVAYVLTGMSGGYGGPSMREHAAARLRYGDNPPRDFDAACDAVGSVVFGPMTDSIRQASSSEYCFDDDPADLQ